MADIYLHQRNTGLGNPAYGWKRTRNGKVRASTAAGNDADGGSIEHELAGADSTRGAAPREEFLGLSHRLLEIQSTHRKFPKKIKKLVALERDVALTAQKDKWSGQVEESGIGAHAIATALSRDPAEVAAEEDAQTKAIRDQIRDLQRSLREDMGFGGSAAPQRDEVGGVFDVNSGEATETVPSSSSFSSSSNSSSSSAAAHGLVRQGTVRKRRLAEAQAEREALEKRKREKGRAGRARKDRKRRLMQKRGGKDVPFWDESTEKAYQRFAKQSYEGRKSGKRTQATTLMANFLRFGEVEKEVTTEEPATEGLSEEKEGQSTEGAADLAAAMFEATTPVRVKRGRRRFTTRIKCSPGMVVSSAAKFGSVFRKIRRAQQRDPEQELTADDLRREFGDGLVTVKDLRSRHSKPPLGPEANFGDDGDAAKQEDKEMNNNDTNVPRRKRKKKGVTIEDLTQEELHFAQLAISEELLYNHADGVGAFLAARRRYLAKVSESRRAIVAQKDSISARRRTRKERHVKFLKDVKASKKRLAFLDEKERWSAGGWRRTLDVGTATSRSSSQHGSQSSLSTASSSRTGRQAKTRPGSAPPRRGKSDLNSIFGASLDYARSVARTGGGEVPKERQGMMMGIAKRVQEKKRRQKHRKGKGKDLTPAQAVAMARDKGATILQKHFRAYAAKAYVWALRWLSQVEHIARVYHRNRPGDPPEPMTKFKFARVAVELGRPLPSQKTSAFAEYTSRYNGNSSAGVQLDDFLSWWDDADVARGSTTTERFAIYRIARKLLSWEERECGSSNVNETVRNRNKANATASGDVENENGKREATAGVEHIDPSQYQEVASEIVANLPARLYKALPASIGRISSFVATAVSRKWRTTTRFSGPPTITKDEYLASLEPARLPISRADMSYLYDLIDQKKCSLVDARLMLIVLDMLHEASGSGGTERAFDEQRRAAQMAANGFLKERAKDVQRLQSSAVSTKHGESAEPLSKGDTEGDDKNNNGGNASKELADRQNGHPSAAVSESTMVAEMQSAKKRTKEILKAYEGRIKANEKVIRQLTKDRKRLRQMSNLQRSKSESSLVRVLRAIRPGYNDKPRRLHGRGVTGGSDESKSEDSANALREMLLPSPISSPKRHIATHIAGRADAKKIEDRIFEHIVHQLLLSARSFDDYFLGGDGNGSDDGGARSKQRTIPFEELDAKIKLLGVRTTPMQREIVRLALDPAGAGAASVERLRLRLAVKRAKPVGDQRNPMRSKRMKRVQNEARAVVKHALDVVEDGYATLTNIPDHLLLRMDSERAAKRANFDDEIRHIDAMRKTLWDVES